MSSPEIPAVSRVRTDKEYEYWRWRILIGTMIGYIFFYFVRKSITMAMPGLESVGVTKTYLGLFLTIHGVLYGVARFVNGVWSDRVNPRYFMSIGLLLAALTNVFCGLAPLSGGANTLAWVIGTFWIINGWVQGMGFPPCAKSLMHWFAPREHGVKFATWNISHSFGAGLVFLLNSFVVAFGWRYCFLVPAFLSIAGAFFLFWALRDSPEKEGFEPIETYYERTRGAKNQSADAKPAAPCEQTAVEEEPDLGWWRNLCDHVFSNWAIWALCVANFFVYIVRFSILDWAPTFLSQAKGIDLKFAGWATCCYEVCGALGIILSGVLMDKIFKGRGARACFFYMLGCSLASYAFWKLDSDILSVNVVLMCLIGFFIYGPQCLIGCVASTIATKKAGAASSGLTGLFGYLATIVTGFGVGAIVDSATTPLKVERDRVVVATLAQAFEGAPNFDASAFESGVRENGTLGDVVKASEGLCDAQRRLNALKDGAKSSEQAQKNEAAAEKKRAALAEKINGAASEFGVENVDAAKTSALVDSLAEAAGAGRAEIVKAGWPIIFGLLVISSIAAMALFAMIHNVVSPELAKEEAAAK